MKVHRDREAERQRDRDKDSDRELELEDGVMENVENIDLYVYSLEYIVCDLYIYI